MAQTKKTKENSSQCSKTREDHNDLFLDLLSNEDARRRYAVRMLTKNATTREVLDFVHHLRPFQWIGKLEAVKLLRKFSDEPSVERLKTLVLDYNPKVRQAARRALTQLGVEQPYTDQDVEELVSYLDHPSWWVKTNAIKSLTALKDTRAIEAISQLLLDEDDMVRTAAKEAVITLKRIKK